MQEASKRTSGGGTKNMKYDAQTSEYITKLEKIAGKKFSKIPRDIILVELLKDLENCNDKVIKTNENLELIKSTSQNEIKVHSEKSDTLSKQIKSLTKKAESHENVVESLKSELKLTKKKLEEGEIMYESQAVQMKQVKLQNKSLANKCKEQEDQIALNAQYISELQNRMATIQKNMTYTHGDANALGNQIKLKDEIIKRYEQQNVVNSEKYQAIQENVKMLITFLGSVQYTQSNLEAMLNQEIEEHQFSKGNAISIDNDNGNVGELGGGKTKSSKRRSYTRNKSNQNISSPELYDDSVSVNSRISQNSYNSSHSNNVHDDGISSYSVGSGGGGGDNGDDAIEPKSTRSSFGWSGLSSAMKGSKKDKDDDNSLLPNSAPATPELSATGEPFTKFEKRKSISASTGGRVQQRRRKSIGVLITGGGASSNDIFGNGLSSAQREQVSTLWKGMVKPKEGESFPLTNICDMFFKFFSESGDDIKPIVEQLEFRQRTVFFTGFIIQIAGSSPNSDEDLKTMAKDQHFPSNVYFNIGQALLRTLHTRLEEVFDEENKGIWIEGYCGVAESIQKLRGMKVKKGLLCTALRLSDY